MASSAPVRLVRFGVFEVDFRAGELRKAGIRIKLHDQPLQVLSLLLEHPGDLVTREEFRKRLWPGDTFVDFDHGLNNAVNRLRDALGDTADSPKFIETLPRRGYRFVGTVEGAAFTGDSAAVSAKAIEPRQVGRESRHARFYAAIAITVGAILIAGLSARKFLATRGVHSTPIRSLAVLPLANLSGDPSQEYFADGITDALITDMAKISSLRVISRTSVLTYKGTHKPIAEIARELNVDAIVEGSVVRSGNRVRINAQLIGAQPERHLWANAYERDLADVVTLEGELSRAIATEIQVQLTPQEQANLAGKRPVNPAAYNAYLLGRYFSDRGGTDNLQKALEYYEEAIQLDGSYAQGWAGAANAHLMLAIGGHVSSEPEKQKARQTVERALELDPELADAYAVLGSIQVFLDWNWNGASASYNRALALEPANPSAMTGVCFIAGLQDRNDVVMQLAHQVADRAPLDPRAQRGLGHAYFAAGRLDEALSAFQKSLQLNPEGAFVHAAVANVYLARSRPQNALSEAQREIIPEERLRTTAMAYHALGQKKQSDAALAELIAKYADVSAYQVAQAYVFRGETDQAFAWLDRAYLQRDGALVGIKHDPLLQSIHRDPRWAAFLQKMHIPA